MKQRITSFVFVVSAFFAPVGRADPYLPFTNYLPPTTLNVEEVQTGYNDFCRDDQGHINTYHCVDKTIREMERRYDRLKDTCDHRGLFALAYLETTYEYQSASLEEGFFIDPEFVNHEDVIFAKFYFDAYDAWEEGRIADVPPAWRLSFESSTNKEVKTLGDVFLGISAHINRDLPIVLATIGLTDPETGLTRKTDHDNVNAFLARVSLDPAVQASWDPSFSSGIPGTSGATLLLVQGWRENAWRYAERLVEAESPEEEAAIIEEIEVYAYLQGVALRTSNLYLAPLQNSSSRDAYCATHGG